MKSAYDVRVREIFVVRGFTFECSGRRGFRRNSRQRNPGTRAFNATIGSVKSLLLEVLRLSVPAVGASKGIPVKDFPSSRVPHILRRGGAGRVPD